MIRIIARDEWNARLPVRRKPTRINPAEQMGWVFHWIGRAVRSTSASSEAKLLRSFQRVCMEEHQYSDLPHSFYIGHDGTIFEGRGFYWDQFANGNREIYPLNEGGNVGWYTVCWLGGDNQQPSSAVIKNLTRLVHDSRVELGVGLKVSPFCDWRTDASPGARLEHLARTLHNWPIPMDDEPAERSVGAASNPAAPAPPRISPPAEPKLPPPPPVQAPPSPSLPPTGKFSVVQADDGDHAVFVTDGIIKEWIPTHGDFHRICSGGKVFHGGRDRVTGEYRPLLIPRATLDAIKTPGRLPIYPDGWNKGRTCR